MRNTVELLGFYGSDLTIAQSAWCSTSRDLTPKKLERVPALIKMLWESGHETPFEKATVHFLVNTDIATHIHLLKHRIASVNAESARYKELKEDKFYLPQDWSNIPLSQDTQELLTMYGIYNGNTHTWLEALEEYTELGNQLYHKAVKEMATVLGRKRAKESARFFKTYNSQIQADIMFNMRSFANFLKLRTSEHAQLEIREIACQMSDIVEALPEFKATMGVILEQIGS